MTIGQGIADYLKRAEFFNPDYERENEVLSSFKAAHPSLTESHTTDLLNILSADDERDEKFFVADLLYLYPDFPEALIELMLQNAITYRDPSFNRIFLRPCLSRIGTQAVAKRLAAILEEGSMLERIGVGRLAYWVHGGNGREGLNEAIVRQASRTDNPIELYHYKLVSDKSLPQFVGIPDDAMGLTELVKGKPELEDLLFNQLGWQR